MWADTFQMLQPLFSHNEIHVEHLYLMREKQNTTKLMRGIRGPRRVMSKIARTTHLIIVFLRKWWTTTKIEILKEQIWDKMYSNKYSSVPINHVRIPICFSKNLAEIGLLGTAWLSYCEQNCQQTYMIKRMIHYSHEDLVVIEFTGFSRELLSLFYYKGWGLNVLLLPSLYNSNDTPG